MDSQSQSTPISQESFIDKMSAEEIEDLEEFLYEITDELFEDEIINMSKPNFEELITDNIKNHFREEWLDQGICNEAELEEIYEYIDTFLDRIFETFETEIPKRQYFDTTPPMSSSPSRDDRILKQIENLREVPQPEQKSKEWYEFRYNLITASNVYKLLGSESQRNSLIYEKCKPFSIDNQNYFVNANNARQWGIIYEPLSIKIYEKLYQTKVDEFGCIRHPQYECLGASPDGINVEPSSGRFGRMIEVKNIVNRDITGIPKEEYWIQMQIQMETCNLDECDFIETRFKEFEDSSDFYKFDVDTTSVWNTWRGVFLCFLEKIVSENEPTSYVPRFEYMPMDIPIERELVEEWIETICSKYKDTHTLYTTHYWYLDEFSCVLVKRNRIWFKAVLPKILETWKTIENERMNGYEHRAAKKRATIPIPCVHITKELNIYKEDNDRDGNTITDTNSDVRIVTL